MNRAMPSLDAALSLTPERDSAEERYLFQTLAELRRAYELDAKPYIDRLVAIRSMRSSVPLVLTLDQAREFIDFTMSAPRVEP